LARRALAAYHRPMRRVLILLAALGVVGATASVAPAATGGGGVIYQGTTSQNKPFRLLVKPEGVRFRVDWSADCGDNGKPFTAQTVSQRPLALKGSAFSSHESYDATASDGAKVHYDITMSGTVRRRMASGSWQAIATGPYKDGGTYKCDTGKVTWSARRAG
jgi:hypothetical protein